MPGSGRRALRVLYLSLEFGTWRKARHWSYGASLAMEEGLAAAGVRYVTIPTTWLSRAPALVRGRTFDQVWVEAVHTPLSDRDLSWIADLAPVRVGLLAESLTYNAAEVSASPGLGTRKASVEARLPFLTHVLAVDEIDAADIAARKLARTLWWPQTVPRRFIDDTPGPAAIPRGVFGGAVYGARGEWLASGALGQRLEAARPVAGAMTARAFDVLHRGFRVAHRGGVADGRVALGAYVAALRALRCRAFGRWLASLARYAAVVNLPHFVKAYPSRVCEGMAAGRPVVAWEVPDRPRTRTLFTDGEEILLCRDQAGLAAALERLLTEPGLADRIAAAARRRLLAAHTAERRVAEVLEWAAS